ncbi:MULTISPECIES: toprim domain-containing protein [unclassified Chelatococcus]|uniref:toprim domain-containing protein n=1 Tax=unclassified Chelatococcus TaxID=2638111 RepID=UPI001BCDA271|nr:MULTISPECIES: toprim domain-containing protein [unclassified Chelatococcus]MBS7696253.1 toprim domain-containing protein [Chelatococcus sp. YT9]MBX3560081.1 toprim domain-containing protein [Chelatococcus sp.]
MSRTALKDRARGKWIGILTQLGVSSEFLTGKHCPCPICGGKDRFRFDNRDGRGTYICSHCDAGDGATLIMKVKGWDFRQAADEIEAILGDIPVQEFRQSRDDKESREASVKLWKATTAIQRGDHVDRYLRARGIALDEFPPCLRSVTEMLHSAEKRTMHPGMVAVVTAAVEGENGTLHRTYLTLDGRKAAVEPPRKLMPGQAPNGGAVRLAEFTDTLGVAEGIETALSASILFKVPVWAALDAGKLASWRPPYEARRIIVFGDHDASFTGQQVAFSLARRLANDGREVSVEIPRDIGTDWNDVLMMERAAA